MKSMLLVVLLKFCGFFLVIIIKSFIVERRCSNIEFYIITEIIIHLLKEIFQSNLSGNEQKMNGCLSGQLLRQNVMLACLLP